MQAFTPYQREFHLGPAVLEIQTKRDQCKATLGNLPLELTNLMTVQKQLARTLGVAWLTVLLPD